MDESNVSMQSDIDRVMSWCDKWQLTVAVHKCNVLHVGRNNARHQYAMGTEVIPSVSTVVDLGIMVTSDLKFTSHIAQISASAFQRLNLMFRAFSTRDRSYFLKTYMCYVRPLVEYNTPLWSPCTIGDIQTVENVQRSFTRRLPGMHDLSYGQRLSVLDLESLEARRIRFDLIEAFKIIKGFSVLEFGDLFEFKPAVGTRGHRLQLRLRIRPRLDICKHFVANRVVSLWNSLPPDVIEATSVEQFRRRLLPSLLRPHCMQVFD